MNLAFQRAEKSALRSPHRSTRAVSPIRHRSAPSQQILQRKAGCACGGGCPRCSEESKIQMKLAVSQPGDAHEQEADLAADAVMRAVDPAQTGGVETEAHGRETPAAMPS